MFSFSVPYLTLTHADPGCLYQRKSGADVTVAYLKWAHLAHLRFKDASPKDGEMEGRVIERTRNRGQEEGKKKKEAERKNTVDAVMRLVAVATSGAGLCCALIYTVPHERRRDSKWEMEEKWEGELVERVWDLGEKKLTANWGGCRGGGENKT